MPPAPSPDDAVDARTSLPADGLPPAGTPVPPDAPPPLTELLTGAPAAPGEGAAEHADEDPQHDVLGAVGLGAKLRAVLRVKDFRKLWLSMSLSSFGDWLGLLAITATAASLVNGFAAKNFALGGGLLFRLLPAIVPGPPAGALPRPLYPPPTMGTRPIIPVGVF